MFHLVDISSTRTRVVFGVKESRLRLGAEEATNNCLAKKPSGSILRSKKAHQFDRHLSIVTTST
jgi:hypothetical protein